MGDRPLGSSSGSAFASSSTSAQGGSSIASRLLSLNNSSTHHHSTASGTASTPTTLGPPISAAPSWSSPSNQHPDLGWMTPLPSPLDGPSRAVWDWKVPLGSERRNRAVSASSSVFEEFRERAEQQQQQQVNPQPQPPTSPSESVSSGTNGPARSKTLSFFDTASTLTSPVTALSPPPNPPSRSGSLSRRDQLRTPSGGSWLDRAREREASDADEPTLSPSPLRKPPAPFTANEGLTSSPEQDVAKPNARFLSFGRPGGLAAPNESPRAVSLPTSFLSLDSPTQPGSLSPRKNAPALSVAIPRAPILQPAPPAKQVEDEGPIPQAGDRLGDYEVVRVLGRGAFSRVVLAQWKGKQRAEEDQPEQAALKLIAKKSYVGNERMRNSVVREVQVLKNIQHPSLSSLLASFPTPLYTVLALDYCPGGELFDFLAEWHSVVPESLARRVFGELAGAVGWMHSIGLVHRDIKLENILLTSRPFPCADPAKVLATLPTPFIKLTDFGLSRFVSPSDPPLTTRCGSEEYAAPELLLGKPYNGRNTDAWALGVCFYALITGVLPFADPGQQSTQAGSTLSSSASTRGRRSYLLKIAKGEFAWPGSASTQSPTSPTSPPPSALSSSFSDQSQHLVSSAARALVGSLLERDPDKRAKVDDVWTAEWMKGDGRLSDEERKAGRVRVPEALTESGVEQVDPLEEEWQRT